MKAEEAKEAFYRGFQGVQDSDKLKEKREKEHRKEMLARLWTRFDGEGVFRQFVPQNHIVLRRILVISLKEPPMFTPTPRNFADKLALIPINHVLLNTPLFLMHKLRIHPGIQMQASVCNKAL